MTDKDIQQKIEEKLSDFDIKEEDLTLEELEKLKEETITEMNGGIIVDGVLSDASIFYRKLAKQRAGSDN